MYSGGTVRAGLRRPGLLFRVQQPSHRTVPELLAADGRRGPLRRVAVASTQHHHPVQLRAAGEEHLQVHAGNVESGRVYTAGAAVHQAIARQQNLPVSTTLMNKSTRMTVENYLTHLIIFVDNVPPGKPSVLNVDFNLRSYFIFIS